MASTVLNVLGVIFILLLVVMISLLIFFWRKVRRFVRELTKEATTSSGTPQTIHLNEVEERAWLEAAPVNAILETLSSHGYITGKVYEVSEMASALVLAVANPQNGTVGGLYHHEVIGPWIELVAETDKGFISFTNTAQQALIDKPDWLEMNVLTDKKISEIIGAFEKRIASENIHPVALEDFRDNLEKNYKRLMKWKNEQGGLTFEEVRLQNEKMADPLDEDNLARAFISVKVSEFNAWQLAMWEELHVNPDLTFPDEPTFIVPDHALCEAFVDYLDDHLRLTDRQLNQLKEAAKGRMDCGPFFDQIMRRLSENLRPKEYCRIEFPLNARVFFDNTIEINELEEPEKQ